MHPGMQALTLEQLDQHAESFDAVVRATAGIDHFCSTSHWIVPAAAALMPPREPWLFRGEHAWVAMMRGQHPNGWHYIEPLEAVWGLACPLLGAEPARLAREIAALLRAHRADWHIALLSGVPAGSVLFHELVRALYSRHVLFQGQSTTRCVASLSGGLDGFLGRRSRMFRKGLRRALAAAATAGITFEPCHARAATEALALYERVQAVERRSWKGMDGVGIDAGPMHEFYRAMVPRLAEAGLLRLMFARHDGCDIAYVLGGVFASSYRGLQFSFDAAYEHLGLGNLCQYHQIVALAAEGVVEYDLGTVMDYKLRWAELQRDSIALIVRKS